MRLALAALALVVASPAWATCRPRAGKRVDVLTGREIREARELLGLKPGMLANRVKSVTTLTVKRAEADDHRPPIADSHMKAIRQTLERLGVEFTAEGPKLREGEG